MTEEVELFNFYTLTGRLQITTAISSLVKVFVSRKTHKFNEGGTEKKAEKAIVFVLFGGVMRN